MITRYTSPNVNEPPPNLWSNCLVCDGIAYIAGLTSRNADGITIDGTDEYEQTKIIFKKHKSLFLWHELKIINRYGKQEPSFFKGDFPACSLVEVSKLADPNIYVEIEGIAHIGKGQP